MKNSSKNLIYILILLVAIFSLLYWYCSGKYNVQVLANLNKNMANPVLIEIKTKDLNSKWMESQFLIIDNDNKNHIEIFHPKTNKIKTLPKSNLEGNFQTYLPLMYTPNKFININVVKEKNNDICGIDIFNINSNKWQKLKTIPILREVKHPPFMDIIYSKDNKPLLLIWGGLNYKTKKPQNTLEVINLLNDKLLEKRNIDFKGGKIIQVDNNYYLVGANNSANKPIILQTEKIKINILPTIFDNPIVYKYSKIYTGTLSSSLDRLALLAINPVEKNLIEYDLPSNIDNSIKVNKINIPTKYKQYSLINSTNTYQGVLFVFKNNVEQLMVLFKNTQNIEQNGSFDYRFKLLKKIGLNIDLTNIKYLESNNVQHTSLIYINNNKILKTTIK